MMRLFPSLVTLALFLILASLTEAIQLSNGRDIAVAPAPKQFPTFCERYRQACIQVVLESTTAVGDRKIIYKCIKNRDQKTFSFGCKNGKGKDLTAKALERVSDSGLSSILTSTYSTTSTATTSTLTETSTTPTSVSTTQTEVVDETTTQTSSSTSTIGTVEASLDFSTVTSYTTTDTLVETSTLTSYVPVTSTTVETATSTRVAPVGVELEEFIINMRQTRRAVRLDNSRFCKAYSSACTRQCTRVGSTPRHQVCRAKPGNRYALSCTCKNGNLETQHALADTGNDVDIVVASTLATATSTILETQTSLVPSTVIVTGTSTVTSTVTQSVTTVFSTTSTSTLSVPVTQTLLTKSLTTSTATPTSLIPSIVATVTSTSTTIVVAATGVVRVEKQSDNGLIGYVGHSRGSFPNEHTPLLTESQATTFMVVRDPATQLIQLQAIDGTDAGKAFCGGSYERAFGFKYLLWCTPDAAPGPAQGSSPNYGLPYETWFTKLQFGEGRSELLTAWMQPDRSIVPGVWQGNVNQPYYYTAPTRTSGLQFRLYLTARTGPKAPV